jgi:hypothetical protein
LFDYLEKKKKTRIFYLDEGENIPVSSSNSGAKKGRGRPPKSAGSTKASIVSDAPKRARGRPAKTGETIPTKPVVAAPPQKKKEEAPPVNGDASKKKRGRPSKGSTPTEQINGISKPQVNLKDYLNSNESVFLKVQPTPVAIHHEQENGNEAEKKKRGRPAGTAPKKVVVVATPSAVKVAAPAKKRGRPAGTAGVKKPAPTPKAVANTDGSAKKRGRPKKSAAPTPTPANETTTVTPNNVQ